MKWQMSILSVKNFPSYLIKWCLFEVFLLFPHVMPLTSYHCRMPFCSCHFFFLPKCSARLHPMSPWQILSFAKLLHTNLTVPKQLCLFLVRKVNLCISFSVLAWSNWWWLGGNYRWPDYWIREAAQAEACIQHCILLTCIAPVWDTEAAVDGG